MRLFLSSMGIKSNSKRIAILVDNPLRDLPACVLLAAELCSDFKVFLVPTAQAQTDLFHLQPDLVILNYLRENNRPMVEKLAQCGIQFSILDTEGGLFMQVPGTDQNTYTMTLIKDSLLRNKVAQVFTWGHELTELLKVRKIYPENRILCLGTPRMDFFSQEFKSYFPKENKDSEKPMVLINTSFAGNNPRYSDKESEKKMLVQKYHYTQEFIDQFFKDLDTVLYGYIDLTKSLAQALPEVHFVLRPHPFESHQIYHEHFSDFKNITVDGSGTSADWLWKTKALVHYECSTAVEAAFLKKPNFSLTQFKDMRPNPFIQSLTHYTEHPQEMVEKIRSVLSGHYSNDEKIEKSLLDVEKRIYFQVDGKSYLRISQEIKKWFKEQFSERTLPAKILAFRFFSFFGLRSLAKVLVKGRLIPEGKAMIESEVSVVCKQLENILDYKVISKKVPLSSSYEIQRT